MDESIDWKRHYEELLPKVLNYFWYRVGDRALAEDLTSTTFEKAWASRIRFRSDLGEFDHWVFGIARKVTANHFRHFHKVIALTYSMVDQNNVDEKIIEIENEHLLKKNLTGLSPRERELLAFKYGAELNNRQIAQLTGLTESNVGVIMFRTIEKLRTLWKEGQNER